MNITVSDKMVVIFSGYNPRAVIAFLRTCTKQNIKYCIVAKSEEDLIFKTIYAKDVFCSRKYKELYLDEFINILHDIKEQYDAPDLVIAPSTEALNRFLIKNSDVFEKMNITIPLVEKRLYELISDKKSFSQYVQDNGLLVPREIELSKVKILPVVAKPKTFYMSNGRYNSSPMILSSETEWRSFKERDDVNEFYIQEFVTGRSIYLLFYINKNGDIFSLSQENLLQQPGGKSIIAAKTSDEHLQDICNLYKDMLTKLRYRGFIMIELRKHNNDYYMIEANPRFWGPSQLFVDSGYNFFEVFLQDYGFDIKPNLTEKVQPTRYFWYGGFAETIKNGEMVVNLSQEKIDINEWKTIDIYNRQDTQEIYELENCGE